MKDIIIDRIIFSQEPDTDADQDDYQRMDVEFIDNGGGFYYYRVRSDGWALDNFSKVLDYCERVCRHNERAIEAIDAAKYPIQFPNSNIKNEQ